MVKISEVRKIIKKYHLRQKDFHKKEVNNMWKELLFLFDVQAPREKSDITGKQFCKFCNRYVNGEEYNLPDEICYKCYEENIREDNDSDNEA